MTHERRKDLERYDIDGLDKYCFKYCFNVTRFQSRSPFAVVALYVVDFWIFNFFSVFSFALLRFRNFCNLHFTVRMILSI